MAMPSMTGRRRFLALVGSLSVGAIAVACGGAASPTAAPAAKPAESKPAAAEPTKPAAGAAAPTQAAAGGAAPAIPPTPTTQPGVTDLPAPKSGQKLVRYWHNFGAGLSADVHTKQIKMFLDANP